MCQAFSLSASSLSKNCCQTPNSTSSAACLWDLLSIKVVFQFVKVALRKTCLQNALKSPKAVIARWWYYYCINYDKPWHFRNGLEILFPPNTKIHSHSFSFYHLNITQKVAQRGQGNWDSFKSWNKDTEELRNKFFLSYLFLLPHHFPLLHVTA